jgi:hypothetical protein
MMRDEFQPGETAPASGPYVALNIFGTPTCTKVLQQGEAFPSLPRSFTWKLLSAYSADELRDRAQQYRQMAGTASTADVMDALLRLAQDFDKMAASRDRGD